MKRSLAILCVGCSFVMGYLVHWGYGLHQFEMERRELEAHYQSVFPRGSDFPGIMASERYGQLGWSYSEESHRYTSWAPPSGWPRLAVSVEVDAQKKIQKVTVQALTIQ